MKNEIAAIITGRLLDVEEKIEEYLILGKDETLIEYLNGQKYAYVQLLRDVKNLEE
jgi:hypothetical protein